MWCQRLVLASRTRWARPVRSVAWNVLRVFVWARLVRVAYVRVDGRGGFSPAGACPVRVVAGALQAVARTAGKPLAIIAAGAVLSICADRVLAWDARRLLPAAIERPFVVGEGVVAYGQRSGRGRARNAYAVSRVSCIFEGLVTDVGECREATRHCDGPFEIIKGLVTDVFQQQNRPDVYPGAEYSRLL